jgi:hypothetical protein
MAINFVPGAFVGQTLTEGGKTWVWDGQKWFLTGGSGSISDGDFVKRTGDTMIGDLFLKDPYGETSEILDSDHNSIAVHKEYVSERFNYLQNEVLELEEEVDAIAPSVERGVYEYDENLTGPDDSPAPGKFFLLQGDLNTATVLTDQYQNTDYIVLHNTDSESSIDNLWTDVEPGKLIQLFDRPDPDFVLGTILEKDTTTFTDAVAFKIDVISSQGSPTNRDPYFARLKIFDAPSGGDASEFLLNTGDKMFGVLRFNDDDTSSKSYNLSDSKSHITFSTNNGTGSGRTASIFQPGFMNEIVASTNFICQGDVYTGEYLLGANPSGSNLNPTQPKIHFTNNEAFLKMNDNKRLRWDGNGGALMHANSEALTWNNNSVTIKRQGTNTKQGFLIKGTVNGDYTSSTGSDGNLLEVYHNSGSGLDEILYRGQITKDQQVVNKKFVDKTTVKDNSATGKSRISIKKEGNIYYITGGD